MERKERKAEGGDDGVKGKMGRETGGARDAQALRKGKGRRRQHQAEWRTSLEEESTGTDGSADAAGGLPAKVGKWGLHCEGWLWARGFFHGRGAAPICQAARCFLALPYQLHFRLESYIRYLQTGLAISISIISKLHLN